MPSDTFTLGWASDNPRAAKRIYELCEGRSFGAELLPDTLADELDPPVERGSMLVRLADDRVYVVAPDGSDGEDLAALLAPGGLLLVETYGIASDGRLDAHTIEVQQPGGVYAGDEYVYWGFGAGGLAAIAQLAGLAEARVDGIAVVDGHPRIMATLTRAH